MQSVKTYFALCPALLGLLALFGACAGPAADAPTPTSAARPTTQPSATPTTQPSATPTAQPSATPTAQPSATAVPTTAPAPPSASFGYPIGWPGQLPGDGFFARHAYASENTWYNPGYWHTGEDWYAREGDSAGAEVYAIATGTVVYVGSNYPGRVVIVEHAPDLFSMYGHLDPAVAVAEGDMLERGQLLGVVLRRGDDVPNHLHFEVRTFLFSGPVNGPAPRYAFRCGPNCAPGPGYWPIEAPDHPSDLGWRNPAHVIAGHIFPPGLVGPLGAVQVIARPPEATLTLWSAPPGPGVSQEDLGELALQPGERLGLLGIAAGPEDSRATSAAGYSVWYRVELPDGRTGWLNALLASSFETGADGRPSSVVPLLVPVP